MSITLNFARPLIGLEFLETASLDPVEGAEGLYALRGDDIRLFVIDASEHLPEYAPVFTEEQAASVGLGEGDDALVLAVVTPEPQITVNLAAPIIVNRTTGGAGQHILEGDDWSLRYALVP